MRGSCLFASLSFFDVDALSRRGCSSADNTIVAVSLVTSHGSSEMKYLLAALFHALTSWSDRPWRYRPLYLFISLSLCMFNHNLCYPFRPPNDSCLPGLSARFTWQNTPADWTGTLNGPLRRRYFHIVRYFIYFAQLLSIASLAS
jgi:hypothetical protein